MTTSLAHKRITLANGESAKIAVPSLGAAIVRWHGKFGAVGGGGGSSLSIFSGVATVTELTFSAKAAMTDGDNFIIYDEDGQGWGFYAEVINNSGVIPSYTEWDLLDGDHIVQINVSGDTTAQQVATNFRGGRGSFTALPTFIDKFAVTAAVAGKWSAIAQYTTDGYRKPLADAPITADELNGSSGSISAAVTAAGSEGFVSVSQANLKQIAHGLSQDDPVTFTSTDGTFPDGIVQDVEYYASIISADEFQIFDVSGGGGFVVGPNSFGSGTMEGTGGSGSATVDADVIARGTIAEQGQTDDAAWHELAAVNVATDSDVITTLNGWPFAVTELEVTNNSADDLDLDFGIVAVD